VNGIREEEHWKSAARCDLEKKAVLERRRTGEEGGRGGLNKGTIARIHNDSSVLGEKDKGVGRKISRRQKIFPMPKKEGGESRRGEKCPKKERWKFIKGTPSWRGSRFRIKGGRRRVGGAKKISDRHGSSQKKGKKKIEESASKRFMKTGSTDMSQ